MSSLSIEIFSAERSHSSLAELAALFEDAVESGASVGFVLPLEPGEALRYWEGVVTKISSGDLILLVAWQDSRTVGSVQLCLEKRPNGRHRAEVVKLLVHRSARRRGIGQALMQAVEKAALDERSYSARPRHATRRRRRPALQKNRLPPRGRNSALRTQLNQIAGRHGHLLQRPQPLTTA
jgi:GNAT superfamily N-acetyltransferase